MDVKDILSAITGPIVDLKTTSKDFDNGAYLTNSPMKVIHYDKVKENHVKDWGLSETPKSADALHLDQCGLAVFIEFKNSPIKGNLLYEVRRKMRDSLILLEDLVPNGWTFSHEKCDFILVYGEEKNLEDDTDQDPEKKVASSSNRLKIASYFLNAGGKELVRFNLHEFENYCYRAVHTYTEREFEDKFVSKARTILP